jgi:hypothetical protein
VDLLQSSTVWRIVKHYIENIVVLHELS